MGYGCTTCIGNSGPLPEAVGRRGAKENLVVAAVLSGNRNFEGRINPLVKANYLASPPLVVAYALAGRMDIDLTNEPLGQRSARASRSTCKDIWPTNEEVQSDGEEVASRSEMFQKQYAEAFEGDANWKTIRFRPASIFEWDDNSTYIKKPPYFDDMVDPGDVRSRISAGCACWRCWAIR